MKYFAPAVAVLLIGFAPGLARVAAAPQSASRLPPGVTETVATVDGVRINYKTTGHGPAVVLLHGFAETSHMWLPLMTELAGSHTVIAPDLRGAGDSERTPSGYDKKTMAKDIRGLVHQLGYDRVTLVGHDIGLMVAYAYAAQYPKEVGQLVLMDAFLPGIGDWKSVWLMRDLWHFHFRGETPEALVKGRERIYLEHFWNDFAADRTKSVPEADRQLYAAAYARDGGIHATFQYFGTFEQDAADFAGFAATKLEMPVLVLTGEKASGNALIEQTRLVATHVRGVVVTGSGHWLMEEAPRQVIPELVAFIAGVPGTSGVSGIETSLVQGDPARSGAYTILLKVPANTRIEAHDHPDDRSATVVSGTWYFGYGDRFDERALKAMPPGTTYTERPDEAHFARTGDTAVVVRISGVGPSGTRYRATNGATK